MSAEGMKWFFETHKRADIPPRAKAVAVVLGNRHNGKTGQCTPGQWRFPFGCRSSARARRRGYGLSC
jgi:hypothetical protein